MPIQTYGTWRDYGPQPRFVAASYNNQNGWFGVLRDTQPPSASRCLLSLGTVLDVDRIRIAPSHDVFVLCGEGLTPGSGFVVAIGEDGGVFGSPAVLWAGQGRPVAARYSALIGELLVLDTSNVAQPVVRWASFTPATLTPGAWGTMPIDVSQVAESTSFSMSITDLPSLLQARAIVSCDNLRGSRIELALNGSGGVTQTLITSANGGEFGICQAVIIERGVVCGFGPPGAVLEAFSVASNTTRGVTIADGDGYAEIPVSGIATGELIGVRDLVTGAGTGATRKAFSVVGSARVGASGLTPDLFGANSSATLVAGDSSFRVLCFAEAPTTAPQQYPAIAVFGYPSNIVYTPELGHVMVGAEVITFPAGMTRSGTTVRGYADVPIPASAVGLTICFQWMALDGATVASSNIACMTVQSSN